MRTFWRASLRKSSWLVMVAVDVLAKQCNLSDPVISQVPDFVYYWGGWAIPFPASHEWDDAEAAHVIAASHDAEPGVLLVLVTAHWENVSVRLVLTQLYVHGQLVWFVLPI